MIEVKITNRIEDKINEYIKKHGTKKSWIAEQIGMLPQTMNKIIKKDNMTMETLLKFAYILECNPEDLYEYEIRKKS